ncbi:hypothetical protein EI42_06002 [Thermosporothrix hazakensis]|jgi:hypothetical protein|uniref:Uncharacterized protein n=2 Tax=Thermosporothrix hazakensis TaxID=644383 RepID=A0A326TSY7_THEHA|nr:hypothetical protein EI42_06002 [Thermosporothrix hazakensis]GCE49195.1 hypothetical protein KTH_40640 [Thermosporothrix hazakensis]
MDRTAALSFLQQEYRELAIEAKFTPEQTADAYSTAIDMSLRHLGVAEQDLPTASVAQADTLKFIALLNYYALKRFSRLLAIRFDVELPGPVKASRSQAFDRVQMLLKDAEAELAGLDIQVGGQTTQGFQLGRLQLDFLEPGLASGSEF